MSNASIQATAATATDTTATVPEAFLVRFLGKQYSSVDAAKAVKGFVQFQADNQFPGIALDERVTPSMITLSLATAKTGMGAKASKEAFVDGLFYMLAKHAYGAKLDDMQAELPRVSQFALVAACASIKQGAGLSLQALLDCSVIGLTAALALPMAQKKAKPAVIAPPANVVGVPAPTENNAAAPMTLAEIKSAIALLNPDMDGEAGKLADAAEMAELAMLAKAEAEAHAKAEREAVRARMEQDMFDRLQMREESARVRAHAFAAMANELGIKLTAAQLKALDKFEAVAA